MSRLIMFSVISILALPATAQQKEGKVTYQRTMELNISLQGNPELARSIPKTRTNTFELNFDGSTASWKQLQELQTEEAVGPGISLQFAGSDDLNWFDLANARKLQQTELAGKNYLVSDSIKPGNWKLTDETKNILGHPCRKAISTVISRRFITSMDNGKMERKEMPDTSQSEAWFTTDIPVPVGPEVQGQLPGLILELSLRSGKVLYTALEISAKPDGPALKEPTRGKKMNAADFAKERSRIMEQMQQSNGRGPVRFSMSAQ
ncbi:MAG: GLPGLI family protein [Chitinophagaceae bacterium]|nr:MAG: GLPGLI family protein [Chitinophagaceae bacterium]